MDGRMDEAMGLTLFEDLVCIVMSVRYLRLM